MLRIANPGSNIDSFIRIYCEVYEALIDRPSFMLDDMSKTLVDRGLATSCGFMGGEALKRSTREDRSRDPLYNQSKMYSELFKILGWLHPLPDSALTFRFTYLGAHVMEVQRDPAALFKECILGIAYPNAILNILGSYVLRPFSTILRSIDGLSGLICRDELIIGPLCLQDDRNRSKFSSMLKEIQKIRGKWSRLQKKLKNLSEENEISNTTMENYTRFPIAVLKWAGWAKNERRSDIYGKSIPFLVLTDEGKNILKLIQTSRDIRASDLSGLDENTKASSVRVSFYQMLGRAGFDLEPVATQLERDQKKAGNFLGSSSTSTIFSPFQELEPEYLKSLFPEISGVPTSVKPKSGPIDIMKKHGPVLTHTSSRVTLTSGNKMHGLTAHKEIIELFSAAFRKTKDVVKAVELITEALAGTNKDKFYPLVAGLFRVLGYDCRHSRVGVNYERWDALIVDKHNSIPIEIKSPGEEEFISVKAVRQALENKIILSARKAFPSRPETTTLVVGYNLPNDRSEVTSLISDIYAAFNVVIGVIDIHSLLHIVAGVILEGKKHNADELIHLHGIIDVSDA